MTIEWYFAPESKEPKKLDDFSVLKDNLANFQKELLQKKFEARPIQQLNLFTVKIPYDYKKNWKIVSLDFIVSRSLNESRMPDANKLEVKVVDANTWKTLKQYNDTVSINSNQEFWTVMNVFLDDQIWEERQDIDSKLNNSYALLYSEEIPLVFHESDHILYKKDTYTYWITLDFYKKYIQPKGETWAFDFWSIPVSDHFSVILNAVIDYNQFYSPSWHPETTNAFFRPKQLQYYQDYVSQVNSSLLNHNTIQDTKFEVKDVAPGTTSDNIQVSKNNTNEESSEVAKKEERKENSIVEVDLPAAELSEKTISSVELKQLWEKMTYVMTHWRNWLMVVWQVPKKKEENYNFMKKFHFHNALGWVADPYTYIKSEINKSTRLPQFMKDMIACIPMEESSFKNEKTRDFKDANYFRQIIKTTGEAQGLTINTTVDERKDLKKSTKAAIKYFEWLYSTIQSDPNFRKIVSKFEISWSNLEMITSFFALNSYNAWYWNMKRAFEAIINPNKFQVPWNNHNPQSSLLSHMKEYGDFWFIFYITNEYPKHYAVFQNKWIYKGKRYNAVTPKYYIQAPNYVYKLMKYYMLDNPWLTN